MGKVRYSEIDLSGIRSSKSITGVVAVATEQDVIALLDLKNGNLGLFLLNLGFSFGFL